MATAFKPMNTRDEATSFRKTLLVAPAGWGKTTQAKHFQRVYGPGFIISGESGLASVRSAGIDYLPFQSFDGPVDPANGTYSFTEIARIVKTPEFAAAGYKWIMLDSITELSDMAYAWADARATREAVEANKKLNGFDVWGYYSEAMIGGCKFVRDLPYHVILSALEKDGKDENDDDVKLPLLQGNKIQAQIPGIFDNVLYGVSRPVKVGDDTVVQRFIITGHYAGRQGKVRDEHSSVSLVEQTGDVTDILRKIDGGGK